MTNTIGTMAHVRPRDPKQVACEWCEEPSVVAVRLEGKFQQGQFIYACRDHERLANAAKDAAKRGSRR